MNHGMRVPVMTNQPLVSYHIDYWMVVCGRSSVDWLVDMIHILEVHLGLNVFEVWGSLLVPHSC